jgi:hypothetical protein
VQDEDSEREEDTDRLEAVGEEWSSELKTLSLFEVHEVIFAILATFLLNSC